MNRLLSILSVTAIVISFAAPFYYLVIMILVLTIKLPAGLSTGLFYAPFALVFAILAAYKPLIGGILLIIAGGLLFSASWLTNHNIQIYLPIASFSFIGGLLHIIRAYKCIPD
jgi:hypothetical protein